MTDEITFYHNPYSRGRLVHWMLEEVGAPYRIELLDFNQREHKSPAFLAINPMGKIPVIVHRGVVVTEAAAICAYLADAFPAAGLAPSIGDATRGTYLRWLFFGAGCVEPAIVDRMLSREPARAGQLGYGSYDDTVSTLEKALIPGPYITGSRFSAADVYVGSQIGWGLMTKALDARPVLLEYVARFSERAAFKRFQAQNDALGQKVKIYGAT